MYPVRQGKIRKRRIEYNKSTKGCHPTPPPLWQTMCVNCISETLGLSAASTVSLLSVGPLTGATRSGWHRCGDTVVKLWCHRRPPIEKTGFCRKSDRRGSSGRRGKDGKQERTVRWSWVLGDRVEWFSTFGDFQKLTHWCRSGLCLGVQFQKIGNFDKGGKVFIFKKSLWP